MKPCNAKYVEELWMYILFATALIALGRCRSRHYIFHHPLPCYCIRCVYSVVTFTYLHLTFIQAGTNYTALLQPASQDAASTLSSLFLPLQSTLIFYQSIVRLYRSLILSSSFVFERVSQPTECLRKLCRCYSQQY